MKPRSLPWATTVVLLLLVMALASCGDDKEGTPAPGAQPDLRVQSIAFTPASPLIGDTIRVDVQIGNIGAAGAHPTQTLVKLVNTIMCAGVPTPIVDAGGTVTVRCKMYPYVAGAFPVEACADAGEQAAESNETNNCASATIVVGTGLNQVEGPGTGAPR